MAYYWNMDICNLCYFRTTAIKRNESGHPYGGTPRAECKRWAETKECCDDFRPDRDVIVVVKGEINVKEK